MTLAAGAGVFGHLGAGGLALVCTVFLVLGVKGKGKVSLKDNPATIVAYLTGTACSAAGDIWANPERVTGQGLAGLGVGSANGPFGDVRVAAVALLLLIIILCAPMTPAFGAVLGMIAAFIWPAAGDDTVWAIPQELAAAALAMVGG